MPTAKWRMWLVLTPSRWILGLVASRCWWSCRPRGSLRMEAGEDRSPDLCIEPNRGTFCPYLTPSSRRMSSRLDGSCSMPQRTSVLHSGHRSSFWDFRILCRQGLQKVCWHGSTFAVASSFSKHTGHSNRSSRAKSSIFSTGLPSRAAPGTST